MREGDAVGDSRKQPSAAERAYRYLLRQVDLRLVVPGERLPAAKDLAADIGVSRPAVLQALQRMQDEGRVEVGAGRKGVTVQPLASSRVHREAAAGEKNWAELGALIEIIEPGIARALARQGLTPDVVTDAKRLIGVMRGATDNDLLLGAHNRFHLRLSEATGMKTLDALGTMARQLIAQVHDLLQLETDSPAEMARAHDQLLTAILAGDAARAADLADHQVHEVRDALQERFGNHPKPQQPRRAPRPRAKSTR